MTERCGPMDVLCSNLLRCTTYEEVAECMGSGAGDLWDRIQAILLDFDDASLGIIACQGKSRESTAWGEGGVSLYEVHCETFLSKYASGRDLLLTIATTSVVAQLAELMEWPRPCP